MDFVWEKIQITNGEPSEQILIIARNARYVEEWCRIHGINHHSTMIKFAERVVDLIGISDMYYVDLGTDDPEFRALIERWKAIAAVKPLLTPNI